MTFVNENSTDPLWVSGPQLREAVSVEAAADALETALKADELPIAPQRLVLERAGAQFLTMPAAGSMGVGAKLVTVQPLNPERGLALIHSLYVLFGPDTLSPIAVIDGAELTSLRTSAVSAVATRHLARAAAENLVVFGSGVQARAHIDAMRAVRPIARVTVVARSAEPAAKLVRRLKEDGLHAQTGDPSAVATADLICTCTTASKPLFDGDSLAEGVHVNAIGSFLPETREVDGRTVARAQVVVEDRAAVLEEAGDLRIPIEDGTISYADVAGELRDVARGDVRREDERSITLFKSVGVAWEDLVVVAAAARALGIGG